MRLHSKEALKLQSKMMKVAGVIGLLKENRVKEAIDTAMKNGISAKAFGIISIYADKDYDPGKRAQFYKEVVSAIEGL